MEKTTLLWNSDQLQIWGYFLEIYQILVFGKGDKVHRIRDTEPKKNTFIYK